MSKRKLEIIDDMIFATAESRLKPSDDTKKDYAVNTCRALYALYDLNVSSDVQIRCTLAVVQEYIEKLHSFQKVHDLGGWCCHIMYCTNMTMEAVVTAMFYFVTLNLSTKAKTVADFKDRLVVCSILGAKVADDNICHNIHFSSLSGLTLKRINNFESEVLDFFQWDMSISNLQYSKMVVLLFNINGNRNPWDSFGMAMVDRHFDVKGYLVSDKK
jgi:hypothetical protein